MSLRADMYRQRAAEAKQSAARAKNPSIKSAFEEVAAAGSYLPSKWSGLTGNARGRLGQMSRRITGHMNERDFPHLVELKLPPALRDCWTDRVRHDRAAGAERFFHPHGGIARGLVLDLGIKLGPDQHHDGRKPHPHHQADH